MFLIDLRSRMAIYEQIVSQVEADVMNGLLKADEQLPSVRSLSLELALNPNTVSKAYTELERNGIIYTVAGRGCFISLDAKKKLYERYSSDLCDFTKEVKRYMDAGIEKAKLIEIIERAYGEDIK